MSEAEQNLDRAAREFEQWVRDQLHAPVSQRCVHNNTPESGCGWCRIYAEEHPVYDKDNAAHEQSAPEGEEWRANGCFIDRIDRNGRYQVVAQAGSEECAATILRNHRLAALVPGLVEALKGVRLRGCWCELPPNITSPDHTIECDAARAALNAVAKEWKE